VEVSESRHIKSGEEYNHHFPKANGEVVIIKRYAKLEDTIEFLPKAIEQTLYQTKDIAKIFAGYNSFESCKKIWAFIFDHILYQKDESGKEQIQSPQYTWARRKGDCDDYTVMIVSILRNLKINVILRISMYTEENGYQHIYPVAILSDGTEVIMDCVAKRFNYEVPYIKKIDKNMELQFLNGIPDTRNHIIYDSVDAEDLLEGYEGDDIGELGKAKLKAKVQNAVKKVQQSKVASNVVKKTQNVVKKVQQANVIKKVQTVAKKVKDSKAFQVAKKGLHVANRINPAAALLRTGILTALKTNLFQIAERLRFSYLTPQQAQAKDFDMSKFSTLVSIREKLEKIFFGAGGKVENFKSSILTGKGNHDKQVAGLGRIDFRRYTQRNSLQQILGIETYNSEVSGVQGFGEVGVVATAAVTAATAALTAIAGLLKNLGEMRKGKKAKKEEAANEKETGAENSDQSNNRGETRLTDEGNKNESNSSNSSGSKESEITDDGSKSNGGGGANKSSDAEIPATTSKAEGSTNDQGTGAGDKSENSGNADSSSRTAGGEESGTNTSDATTPDADAGVMTKVKNWVKENPLPATGIAMVVVGGITFGLVKLFSKDKSPKQKETVSGLPHRRKSEKNKTFHSHKITIQRLR